MSVRIQAQGQAFELQPEPGERILLAGLRAGVALPYECATGTCGTCRARLVSGEVRDLWPEAPARAKAKAGEVLMCQCAAEDAAVLELPARARPVPAPAPVPALGRGTLAGAKKLTHDVMAFAVELDAPLDFDAGQFVLLAASGVPGYRAYSMCNHERAARRLDFVVKRKPGGAFSEWLFGASREGAPLGLFGPLGRATFEPSVERSVVCIAGGSGIAGMMAILACGIREGCFAARPAQVFFGVRTLRDAFFLAELSEARRRAPSLKVTVALSDEPVPASAGGEWPQLEFAQGFVHEVARQAMAGRSANVRAYVAGPPPAVDAALRMLLTQARLSPNEIRYDRYS